MVEVKLRNHATCRSPMHRSSTFIEMENFHILWSFSYARKRKIGSSEINISLFFFFHDSSPCHCFHVVAFTFCNFWTFGQHLLCHHVNIPGDQTARTGIKYYLKWTFLGRYLTVTGAKTETKGSPWKSKLYLSLSLAKLKKKPQQVTEVMIINHVLLTALDLSSSVHQWQRLSSFRTKHFLHWTTQHQWKRQRQFSSNTTVSSR